MAKNVVLYRLVKNTFALLLGNEYVGENCEFLVRKLDARIQKLRRYGISNELFTSLSNLKAAFVSLRACFKSLHDQICEFKDPLKQANISNGVSKLNHSNTDYAKLHRELLEIKECDKFKQAMEYFLQSNTLSGMVCEKKAKEEIKITATKVLVISEILGNLTNLSDAADRCKRYISQLHDLKTLTQHKYSFSKLKSVLKVNLLDFPEKEGMKSVMHINVVVFRLMKEFTGKPVVMLDWPMIRGQEPSEFHPIFGELPEEIDPPDPFTYITDASTSKVQIDSCITAINCSGDIYAKTKASTDIVRITTKCDKWYNFGDHLENNINIVSIAIDCTDCKTPLDSPFLTSTQSNAAGLPSTDCHGKMYILTQKKLKNNFHYFLNMVNMKKKTENKYPLEYLQRSSTKVAWVRIFCLRDRKLVIMESAATKQVVWVRICNHKGELQEKINMTAQLVDTNIFSISYNGEIVCSNGEGTLKVYDLSEERISEKPPSKSCQIKIDHDVKAVAYNHELEKLFIICHRCTLKWAWSNQCHLRTYTKAGKLLQDIELSYANDKYENTKLICHPSGPIVLLDNDKLLYLKR